MQTQVLSQCLKTHGHDKEAPSLLHDAVHLPLCQQVAGAGLVLAWVGRIKAPQKKTKGCAFGLSACKWKRRNILKFVLRNTTLRFFKYSIIFPN